MSLSKRLRFEILKRDGFRCHYCGRNAAAIRLEIDHVMPIADGGGDEQENLITACVDCNRGKGAVSLDESKLDQGPTAAELAEQVEQVRHYLAASRELREAMDEAQELLADEWRGLLDEDPLKVFYKQLPYIIRHFGIERATEAMEATAARTDITTSYNRVKYFWGVLRRMEKQGLCHSTD